MKTVYDLYHWDHPDACAEVRRGFEYFNAASMESGHPNRVAWRSVRGDSGWLLDASLTGGKREWGIFERREAETDTERVQLALELLAADGQVEGSHHQAWVIDQVARILAGDAYEQWIAEYRDGEDGPETYSWNEGIAP